MFSTTSANVNPGTCIRYSVISLRSLDYILAEELMNGPDAVDLTYQAAYEDAKAGAGREFDDAVEDAELAAAETDHNMGEEDYGNFVDEFVEARLGTADRDEHIENRLEEFSDCYQDDEPHIEGVYDDVRYQITWLGGAPILWVFDGPVGACRSLCSPCVPGAGDLDSGFVGGGDPVPADFEGYECYVVPSHWMATHEVAA